MRLPKHGSPADRGSADRYYGRPRCPHFFPQGTYVGPRVMEKDMTPDQIEAYNRAYEAEDDEKPWGFDHG